MNIQPSGSQASKRGPEDYFTGTVRIDAPFSGSGNLSAATVTFEPGAQTAWHTHPLGQTLLVVAGLGRVQREGGPIEDIRPGDIVWFEPGEKHWHGAAPDCAMSHIAIAEMKDGSAVTHAALPLMRGRPGAMVSTVSSVGGRYGIQGWSVYNATKFAVIGLHDALRKELGGEGIRFSVIEPGAVWTEWGHNVPEGAMRERRHELDALTAEDVANALVYSFAQPPRVLIEELLIRPVKQIAP